MSFGDRNTPLRRTGFKQKAPANTARKPRKPLAQRSKKRQVHMTTERVPMLLAMIEDGRSCEVCPVLHAAGIFVRCTGTIEGLHERRKSSGGGSRSNPVNLIPACNLGNGFLEDNPAQVREATGTRLVLREGDEGWDELGARAWRERAS